MHANPIRLKDSLHRRHGERYESMRQPRSTNLDPFRTPHSPFHTSATPDARHPPFIAHPAASGVPLAIADRRRAAPKHPLHRGRRSRLERRRLARRIQQNAEPGSTRSRRRRTRSALRAARLHADAHGPHERPLPRPLRPSRAWRRATSARCRWARSRWPPRSSRSATTRARSANGTWDRGPNGAPTNSASITVTARSPAPPILGRTSIATGPTKTRGIATASASMKTGNATELGGRRGRPADSTNATPVVRLRRLPCRAYSRRCPRRIQAAVRRRQIPRRPGETRLAAAAGGRGRRSSTPRSANSSPRLKQTGQRDNTLIIFTSDNGGIESLKNAYVGDVGDSPLNSENDPLRGQKNTLYEGGIRVCAFANWPGKLAAAQARGTHACRRLVSDDRPYRRLQATPRSALGRRQPVARAYGRRHRRRARTIYIAMKGGQALRRGDWKLIAPRQSQAPTVQHRRRSLRKEKPRRHRTRATGRAAKNPQRRAVKGQSNPPARPAKPPRLTKNLPIFRHYQLTTINYAFLFLLTSYFLLLPPCPPSTSPPSTTSRSSAPISKPRAASTSTSSE